MSEGHSGGSETPRKRKKVEKGEGLWLFSFSDMSLILMSFFALMLSYSKVDQKKFDNVQDNIKKNQEKAMEAKQANLQTLSDQLDKEIKAQKLDKKAQVILDADGLSIEFSDKLLFTSGSSQANPQFANVTDQVMKIIAKSPDKYRVTFEGHTDDVPLAAGGRFKSNWELSAARSLTLMRMFRTQGVREERMSVIAQAHTRPKVPYLGKIGTDLEAARAANRRVVIKIN